MASAIRQMTGVGGDVRKIARLLQKKAPPGHMLAYINQEEADLLKARGGSGKPHADTGVPSFEEEELFSDIGLAPKDQGVSFQTPYLDQQIQPQTVAPLDVTSQSGSPFAAYERATTPDTARYFQENQAAGAAPKVDLGQGASVSYGDFASAPSGSRYIDQTLSDRYLPSATGAPAATTQDKDLLGQVGNWWSGLSKETKDRLGIGGIQAVIGAYQSQQAAEQGRQAKEEMQRMAQPYQQQGKELIAKAQKGELSPVGQQQLQAVQAQAAQGAQARGGVGAQQAQAQVEAYRQQLLQGQYDYGLKVAGIGDQIMTGAIKTGMQADQYVNQLTTNYYNNIARAMYGQAPQVSGSQPASTTASA
jgi:hypothetical protein